MKKVTLQTKEWFNTVYQSSAIQKCNLMFTGGNNKAIKLSRQYNNIVKTLIDKNHYILSDDPNSPCIEKAAKIFAYNCIIAEYNGRKGFILPRNRTLIEELHTNNPKLYPSVHYWFKVQDIAEKVGYGEVFTGEPRSYVESSINSVFVLSDTLISELQTKDKQQAPKQEKKSPKDAIIVWDSSDRKTRNVKQRITKKAKDGRGKAELLKATNQLNSFLSGFEFKDNMGGVVDPFMSRSFIGDFDNYGRFFHAASRVSQVAREGFTISGEAVCELDYSSNHAMICYELVGENLSSDFKPYMIDESVTPLHGSNEAKRAVYKLGMMMLFNSGNPSQSLYKAVSQLIDRINKDKEEGRPLSNKCVVISGLTKTPSIDDCNAVIKELRKKNSLISEYFKGDNSPLLQNLDSLIAEKVMNILMNKGIPFLPYHDSFIVPKSKYKQLKQAMFEAWDLVLGSCDNCRVDAKQQDIQTLLDKEEITEVEEAIIPNECTGVDVLHTFHDVPLCSCCGDELFYGNCINDLCKNYSGIPF